MNVISRNAVVAIVAVAGAGVLAALVGSWAADIVRPAKPASPTSRTVSVGPARLVVPADWRAVSPSSADVAQPTVVFEPASRPGMRVVAAFEPTVGPSLVPAALGSTVLTGGPRLTRVGGWPAWTYPAEAGSVTALASTAGVLGVACTTVTGQAAPDCASDVDSVTVAGAAALVPSSSLALEIHLPAVLDQLNRARSQDRATLKSARTHEAQALAARRLGADHRAAAQSLRRLGGPAAEPLIRDLTSVAEGYRALAGAANDAAPAQFAAVATRLRRAEALLAGGVAAVPRPETTEVVARVAVPRRDGDGSPPGGVPPVLFALLTVLAMGAGAVTGNSEAPSRLRRRLFPA